MFEGINNISDRDELCAALQRVDISVPARKTRTTHHTETWMMCRPLTTLANAKGLFYPLSVKHQDKPDFLIVMENTRIGIEVTEAISAQYSKYCALAEKEFPDALLEPAHFGWDAPERSKEEMREMLRQNQLTSSGWTGDRPEREWALFVQSFIDKKLEKLAASDFTKYDTNWLSIYDNLPLMAVDLERAMAFLRPQIQDCWSRTPSFDALFVECGSIIVKITASDLEYFDLSDLWK